MALLLVTREFRLSQQVIAVSDTLANFNLSQLWNTDARSIGTLGVVALIVWPISVGVPILIRSWLGGRHGRELNQSTNELQTDTAIKYCDESWSFYLATAKRALSWHRALQVIALVYAALGPIYALVPLMPKEVIAIPGILAALSLSLDRFFGLRETWVRHSVCAVALGNARLKYVTEAKRYPDTGSKEAQDNLNQFVRQITKIILDETTSWETFMLKSEDAQQPREQKQ